jgi:hypothetical protein
MAEQRNAAVSIEASCALAKGDVKVSAARLSIANTEDSFLTDMMGVSVDVLSL